MSTEPARLIRKWTTMCAFAKSVSLLSTAKIRLVGAVVFDARCTRVLGFGYNGQATGVPHTYSGDSLDIPSNDLHAEVNALMKCPPRSSVSNDKVILVTTCAPCRGCAGYMLNYGVDILLITDNEYDRNGDGIALLEERKMPVMSQETLTLYNPTAVLTTAGIL